MNPSRLSFRLPGQRRASTTTDAAERPLPPSGPTGGWENPLRSLITRRRSEIVDERVTKAVETHKTIQRLSWETDRMKKELGQLRSQLRRASSIGGGDVASRDVLEARLETSMRARQGKVLIDLSPAESVSRLDCLFDPDAALRRLDEETVNPHGELLAAFEAFFSLEDISDPEWIHATSNSATQAKANAEIEKLLLKARDSGYHVVDHHDTSATPVVNGDRPSHTFTWGGMTASAVSSVLYFHWTSVSHNSATRPQSARSSTSHASRSGETSGSEEGAVVGFLLGSMDQQRHRHRMFGVLCDATTVRVYHATRLKSSEGGASRVVVEALSPMPMMGAGRRALARFLLSDPDTLGYEIPIPVPLTSASEEDGVGDLAPRRLAPLAVTPDATLYALESNELVLIKAYRRTCRSQMQRELRALRVLGENPALTSVPKLIRGNDAENFTVLARHPTTRFSSTPEASPLALGDVLEALSFAHAQGICHRNVSLDNVLVSRDGARAVLANWGGSGSASAPCGKRDVVLGAPFASDRVLIWLSSTTVRFQEQRSMMEESTAAALDDPQHHHDASEEKDNEEEEVGPAGGFAFETQDDLIALARCYARAVDLRGHIMPMTNDFDMIRAFWKNVRVSPTVALAAHAADRRDYDALRALLRPVHLDTSQDTRERFLETLLSLVKGKEAV